MDDVSFAVKEGEIFGLLGPNGAGKSTLIRMMTTLIPITAGTVRVEGHDVARDPDAVRRTIGVIYEDFRLLQDRTVYENVAVALHIAGQFVDSDVAPKVKRALHEVGLAEQRDLLPAELSFGERQRCAIARAIVNRPALILADEPTGALEPKSAAEVLSLLLRIHREGAALLLGTTRAEVANVIGGKRYLLEDGRLSLAGNPVKSEAKAAGGGA